MVNIIPQPNFLESFVNVCNRFKFVKLLSLMQMEVFLTAVTTQLKYESAVTHE